MIEVRLMHGDEPIRSYRGCPPQVGETIIIPHGELKLWKVVNRHLLVGDATDPHWSIGCEAVVDRLMRDAEQRAQSEES